MEERKTIRTEYGQFSQDYCGIWHYTFESGMGTIYMAAADAIAHRPDGAAWFWFGGTPAHIGPDEDSHMLINRWTYWRNLFHSNNFMNLLEAMREK